MKNFNEIMVGESLAERLITEIPKAESIQSLFGFKLLENKYLSNDIILLLYNGKVVGVIKNISNI